MIDKLSGENAPKLHLVAFNASEDIQRSLLDLSKECHGHFHSHTLEPDTLEPGSLEPGSLEPDAMGDSGCSVRDTDITSVREEVVKAQRILSELRNLEHGNLGQDLIATLREVS